MITPSSFVLFQLSVIALLMLTMTAASTVPQSDEVETPSYHDEQRSVPHLMSVRRHHYPSTLLKHLEFTDDDNSSASPSDEENSEDLHPNPAIVHKRDSMKMARAGYSAMNNAENRMWAIPYRFGKRAAMPYRFGKRAAAMHFRLGKKSASL